MEPEFFDNIKHYRHTSGLEISSFNPVAINDWIIMVSVSNIDSVVLIMQKRVEPFEFVMGTFTDELKANDFLNFWLDLYG